MENRSSGKELLSLLLIMAGVMVLYSCVCALLASRFHSLSCLLIQETFSQLLCFALPVLLILKMYHHEPVSFLQLRFDGDKWKKCAVVVVIWALSFPILNNLTAWNDGWHLGPSFQQLEQTLRDMSSASQSLLEQFLSQQGLGHLAANLFAIALLPAICEELFFRCGIQQIICRWTRSPHIAVILSAVIFSAAHLDLFGFVPRFLLGLLLGYLFYYGGSILLNSALHFVNNAVVVVSYYLFASGVSSMDPSQNFDLPWTLSILCAIAAVGVFAVSIKESPKFEKQ